MWPIVLYVAAKSKEADTEAVGSTGLLYIATLYLAAYCVWRPPHMNHMQSIYCYGTIDYANSL
jgi:hypothetical protein